MNRSPSAAGRDVKYIGSMAYIDDFASCHRLLKYNQQKYGRFYIQRRLLEGQRINCSNYKGVKKIWRRLPQTSKKLKDSSHSQ